MAQFLALKLLRCMILKFGQGPQINDRRTRLGAIWAHPFGAHLDLLWTILRLLLVLLNLCRDAFLHGCTRCRGGVESTRSLIKGMSRCSCCLSEWWGAPPSPPYTRNAHYKQDKWTLPADKRPSPAIVSRFFPTPRSHTDTVTWQALHVMVFSGRWIETTKIRGSRDS